MDAKDIIYYLGLQQEKKEYKLTKKLPNKGILDSYLRLVNNFDFNLDDIDLNITEKEEFFYLTEFILTNIFPKDFNYEKLINLTTILKAAPLSCNGNQVVVENVIKNKETKYEIINIYVNFPISIEGVSFLIHEYGHCLVNKPYQNLYNRELISILLERITTIILSDYTKKENIIRNNDIFRGENTIGCVKSYLKLKGIDKIFNKDLTLTYIISDLLSIILMNYYMEDNNKFTKKVKLLINNEIKIEDIINYYNIELNKEESYDLVKKKLRNVK